MILWLTNSTPLGVAEIFLKFSVHLQTLLIWSHIAIWNLQLIICCPESRRLNQKVVLVASVSTLYLQPPTSNLQSPRHPKRTICIYFQNIFFVLFEMVAYSNMKLRTVQSLDVLIRKLFLWFLSSVSVLYLQPPTSKTSQENHLYLFAEHIFCAFWDGRI